MAKALDKKIIEELRVIMRQDKESGRVQRGVSWPETMDKAVNEYMKATGIERSMLVQVAVARFLSISAPKATAPTSAAFEYVPLTAELTPA